MDGKMVALIVFGMIAFMIGGSEAFTCYSCNSTTTRNCIDPFSANGVSTCTGTTCVKGWGSLSGITFVMRGCESIMVAKDQCFDMTVAGVSEKICMCSSDYSNDAGILKTTYKIIIAVITVIAIT